VQQLVNWEGRAVLGRFRTTEQGCLAQQSGNIDYYPHGAPSWDSPNGRKPAESQAAAGGHRTGHGDRTPLVGARPAEGCTGEKRPRRASSRRRVPRPLETLPSKSGRKRRRGRTLVPRPGGAGTAGLPPGQREQQSHQPETGRHLAGRYFEWEASPPTASRWYPHAEPDARARSGRVGPGGAATGRTGAGSGRIAHSMAKLKARTRIKGGIGGKVRA